MTRYQREQLAQEYRLKFQVEFENTLDRIAEIRVNKCAQYGESRYEETDKEFNRWMLFSDIHRKYIRLRQQIRQSHDAGLLETYTDLAAYALMAVQILSRQETQHEGVESGKTI